MFDTNLKHWMAASFVGAVVLVATIVNVNYPKAADADVQSTPLMGLQGAQAPCPSSESGSVQPSANQRSKRSIKGRKSGSSQGVRPSAGSRLQRQGGTGGEQRSTGTRESSPEPYIPTGDTGRFQQPTAAE